MDEGTDFTFVLQPDLTLVQLSDAVTRTYTEVQQSTTPERSAAVANEIATTQPDLIGLQEVSLWQTGPVRDCACHHNHLRRTPITAGRTEPARAPLCAGGRPQRTRHSYGLP